MRLISHFLAFCFLISPVISSEDEPKIVRILSLDGGGSRGIITASYLETLEKLVDAPLASKFHLIAGTSAGGILSLGLTHPHDSEEKGELIQRQPAYTASQLKETFKANTKIIFQTSWSHRLWSLGGFFGVRYYAEPIEGCLQKQFGVSLLSDCITPTLVTSTNLKDRSLFLFRSWHAQTHPKYNFLKLQAGCATSAAPAYFPSFCGKNLQGQEYDLVDGGVVCNNPSLIALAEAKKLYPEAKDFFVVSIGTGTTFESISEDKVRYGGGLTWMLPVINLMMAGDNQETDECISNLLSDREGKKRYYRFQPFLPERLSALDGSSDEVISGLEELARQSIELDYDKLQQIAEELKKPMAMFTQTEGEDQTKETSDDDEDDWIKLEIPSE